jgi:hypothetical protein
MRILGFILLAVAFVSGVRAFVLWGKMLVDSPGSRPLRHPLPFEEQMYWVWVRPARDPQFRRTVLLCIGCGLLGLFLLVSS